MADDAGSAEPRARRVCFGGVSAADELEREETGTRRLLAAVASAHPREAQSGLRGNQKM
jgi:hypothetical protein